MLVPADARPGDRGFVQSACLATNRSLQRLCEGVEAETDQREGTYVHLGGEFYVVSTPRRSLFTLNVRTGQSAHSGWLADVDFGEVVRRPDGTMVIRVSMSSPMRGGFFGEAEFLIEVRRNPISRTPYLLEHQVQSKTFASEEIQSLCARPENVSSSQCADRQSWGRMEIELGRADVERLIKAPTVPDRGIAERILASHSRALAAYRVRATGAEAPVFIMEKAGLRRIVDIKPPGMTQGQYVHVLNDYAFFAYPEGGSRTGLAIEILDKVVRLSPGRRVAYLNMADALGYLAGPGNRQYPLVPLGPEAIKELMQKAAEYRHQYQMLSEPRQNGR